MPHSAIFWILYPVTSSCKRPICTWKTTNTRLLNSVLTLGGKGLDIQVQAGEGGDVQTDAALQALPFKQLNRGFALNHFQLKSVKIRTFLNHTEYLILI